MIWRAVLFVILAMPVRAEITLMDRFDDCLGIRAKALGMESWATAPCQTDRSCSEYDESSYLANSALICALEAFSICKMTKARPHDTCFPIIEEQMAATVMRISADYPKDRFEALRPNLSGMELQSLDHYQQLLHGNLRRGPIAYNKWPFDGLPPDRRKDLIALILRFDSLLTIERWILQSEAK